MYPQLFNQASRLAPMLSRVLSRGGSFASPFWKTQQIDVPSVNAQPLPGAPAGPTPPISGDNSGKTNYSAGQSPLDQLNHAFSQFKNPLTPIGYSTQGPSPLDTAQWPSGPVGAPAAQPAPAATPSAGVPMLMARPADAPQSQPDTSFFMRNALMQQDPMGGGYIDPAGAASVRGPDLIEKMMGYLHNKVS